MATSQEKKEDIIVVPIWYVYNVKNGMWHWHQADKGYKPCINSHNDHAILSRGIYSDRSKHF